jgi:hypothetical protein
MSPIGKSAILSLCVFLSFGASLVRTSQEIAAKWDGRTADEFFAQYGPPIDGYATTEGNQILQWSSGVIRMGVPGMSTSTGYVVGNMVHITTTTTPPASAESECRIDLMVSPAGQILKLGVVLDTIGLLRFSRCREVFKLPIF